MKSKPSIWIDREAEEPLRNAGFSFSTNGECPVYYKCIEIGYLSNLDGLKLYKGFESHILPILQRIPGVDVWSVLDDTEEETTNLN